MLLACGFTHEPRNRRAPGGIGRHPCVRLRTVSQPHLAEFNALVETEQHTICAQPRLEQPRLSTRHIAASRALVSRRVPDP
jgi:hypothetical protein